jgi:hypothetical protein
MILHKTPAHDAAGDCSTCGGDPNKDFGDPSFPLACPERVYGHLRVGINPTAPSPPGTRRGGMGKRKIFRCWCGNARKPYFPACQRHRFWRAQDIEKGKQRAKEMSKWWNEERKG